jgi:hypothetical protein
VLSIAQAAAVKNSAFLIVEVWVVGNLIVIPAQRCHQPQLVGRIGVEDKRTEAAEAVGVVVNDLRNGRLQAEIAAIGVDAGVVGEAFGVAAEAEGVVGLIEISRAEDKFRFVVALEARAGYYVEDAVGTIAELRAVASAIDFQIVDILGIDLRAQVRGDVGVGHGHAIDQPTGLVPAANVKLVVRYVRSGNVVGDQGETVAAGGAGSVFYIEAADERGRSCRVDGRGFRSAGNIDGLFVSGDAEGKMQNGLRSGIYHDTLHCLIKAGSDDSHGVLAEGDAVEIEFTGGVGVGGGSPVRRFRVQHDHGVLDRTVLGIVNDAPNRSEGGCEGGDGDY